MTPGEGYNYEVQPYHKSGRPACTEIEILAKLVELIELHYREEKSQEFYCTNLNLSYYYLNRLAAYHLRKTVNGLLQDRLLREAVFLLMGTIMSTKRIAYELGFSDPSNFVRFFKKHVGKTPRQFRKNI